MTTSYVIAAVLWLCFLGLLFSAAALGALAEFSRSKLEKYCQARNIDVLGDILEYDDDVVLALRGWVRILLFGFVLSSFFVYWPGQDGDHEWLSRWVWHLAGLWLLLLAAENWIARLCGEVFAEPLLYWAWPLLTVLRLTMLPLLWVAKVTTWVLEQVSGQDDDNNGNVIQEEILTVVNEGEREGHIPGDAVDMIEGLMELHEVEASEVMTPRTDIIMLPMSMTVEEARIQVIESGHSRIPVYNNSRDDIAGVLYAKDLLPHLDKPVPMATLASIQLRQPIYVPEDKRLDILLTELRSGVHIAIVLDSYGGVAGLVTIEDIIEEVIGEIKDEYDEEESPPLVTIDDHTCDVDARLDIDTINEHLSLTIPDGEDYDTIGGFVSSKLGRIPTSGETLMEQNARFTVLDASDRAILRIRVERVEPTPAPDAIA